MKKHDPQEQQTLSKIAECDGKLAGLNLRLKALKWEIELETSVRDALVKKLGRTPPKVAAKLPPAKPVHVKNAASTGFAEAVRSILHQSPRYPKEVVQGLMAAHFNYTGNTPLSIRVGNELTRLRKSGAVSREEDGRYKLVSTNGAGG